MNPALRLSLAGALAIVLLGYLAIVRSAESALADRFAEADAVRDRIARDAEFARRAPALEAERVRLTAVRERRALHDAPAIVVDRFLHAAARIADRDRVTIQTLAAAAPVPAPRGAAPPLVDELRLDVTIRGAYDDVLHAARALDASGSPLEITVAALGNTERHPGTRPQLNATFHITLLREADARPNPTPHAG